MTRAKDELVMTSAADYGTARARKVSRFVVEALDLPSPAPAPRKSQALEALARHQPAAESEPGPEPPLPDSEILPLSFRQIDDYQTCPLKYKYVHRLRVPLLIHHRIVYGHAIHKAVQEYFRARAEGRAFGEDDLVAAFRAAWVSEGFLSRDHEERRLAAGEDALRRFYRQEQDAPLAPTGIEEDFAFFVDRTRVQGRYDLVVEDPAARSPSSTSRPGSSTARRTRTSARRTACSSTSTRSPTCAARDGCRTAWSCASWSPASPAASGPRPSRRRPPSRPSARSARSSAGASSRAKPSYLACGQCAFRDICPHTARGPEADEP